MAAILWRSVLRSADYSCSLILYAALFSRGLSDLHSNSRHLHHMTWGVFPPLLGTPLHHYVTCCYSRYRRCWGCPYVIMSLVGFPLQYRCTSLNITYIAAEISSDVCSIVTAVFCGFTAMKTRENLTPNCTIHHLSWAPPSWISCLANPTTQSLPTGVMFAQITTYTDTVKFPHCKTHLYLQIL